MDFRPLALITAAPNLPFGWSVELGLDYDRAPHENFAAVAVDANGSRMPPEANLADACLAAAELETFLRG